MKSVFLDYATVSCGDLDEGPLRAVLPDIELFDVTGTGDLHARVAEAGILITNKIALGREVIAAAPALRLIALVATGTNNVDLEAARASGVAVCNIRSYCTASVAQHVFAVILGLTHHLQAYQRLLWRGTWRDSPQFCLLDYPIRELAGKVMGIVGYGELGRAVARLAEAFGMDVRIAARVGTPPTEDRIALPELLPEVDVLSLHCPLTPRTENLIGAAELARMQPDALLMNTARGGLVDAAALASALRNGKLGGAGIDVLTQEPPVDGNPLLADDIPNLIVTPHIAWAAREARQRAVAEVVANVADFLGGGQRGRVV